jgi:hypothetical protein
MRRAQLALAVSLMLLLAGCNGKSDSLAPVHGRIFFKNIPLQTGTIVFTPNESRGAAGPLARAEVQSDGSYHLWTGDKPGATTGWHRVTILALEDVPREGLAEPCQRPLLLLPERYRDPELSGLECEIKAGQDNNFDFHLE